MDISKEQALIDERLGFFFKVMAKDTDVFVANGEGIAICINKNYMDNYNVLESEIIGKRVDELEASGFFVPSVTTQVLKQRKKMTIMQRNRMGEEILTTGVPIFDESGEIDYVVSYPAIDIADLSNFDQKYRRLNELVSMYSREIEKLNVERSEFFGMFTNNQAMKDVYALIEIISDSESSIMISGETGVGKNLICSLIHSQSSRRRGPFVEINCGAIPENLIESELFGYVSGAFSGASEKGQKGKIEAAGGGTLFLDEIGEMPMDMQKKLLQVVQEKRIIPVGGTEYIDVDFRLITATNQDLEKRLKENKFRQDLYYRINVVSFHIPPLRERKEDIPMLALLFLDKFNRIYGKNKVLTQESIGMLSQYEWPGNIREMKNVIERIVLISKNDIVDKPELMGLFSELNKLPRLEKYTLKQKMEAYEKEIILEAYKDGLSTTQMAKKLGIAQSSVVRKLQKYLRNAK